MYVGRPSTPCSTWTPSNVRCVSNSVARREIYTLHATTTNILSHSLSLCDYISLRIFQLNFILLLITLLCYHFCQPINMKLCPCTPGFDLTGHLYYSWQVCALLVVGLRYRLQLFSALHVVGLRIQPVIKFLLNSSIITLVGSLPLANNVQHSASIATVINPWRACAAHARGLL